MVDMETGKIINNLKQLSVAIGDAAKLEYFLTSHTAEEQSDQVLLTMGSGDPS